MRKKNTPNTQKMQIDAIVQTDITLEEMDAIIKWMNNENNLNLKFSKNTSFVFFNMANK